MSDSVSSNLPIQALASGEAELRLVLRLSWEDVAALGAEASRLAAQAQRPVSLDEAASYRLRARTAAHARPAADSAQGQGQPQAQAQRPPQTTASVSQLTGRSPREQAQQAIDEINNRAAGLGGAAARG
ncbi:hypothetical protein E1265_15425 [Streptomyces sp. 8K308]|uniref:hypothetical protein n=1 Tax=Streptomyces sp. 8K308 TaxID=2530388 RepID=UPI0010440DF2|nr:hypothetical protein [Streptomyces sp. 8K308]TDC22543.1 hypothetical protein E1265_15425 [Streptomyces sp. 8K308]